MIKSRSEPEFNEVRSSMYEQALSSYPLARARDLEAMHTHLSPKKGEVILGIGEGNGFFCNEILNAIGYEGRYMVTDPSKHAINFLKNRVNVSEFEVVIAGAEELPLIPNTYDKIWSFGAFHHCQDQTEAMKRMYGSLKPGGRLVLCDVFQGSLLAKHFDTYVARYCNTGHEVKFLSDAFARSLCYLAGFEEDNVKIEDLPQKWVFESEYDVGKFIHDLHAMTLLPGDELESVMFVLEGCKKVLGVNKTASGLYELNWPMKALKATK